MSAQPPDVRRFRPNILIRSLHALPFEPATLHPKRTGSSTRS